MSQTIISKADLSTSAAAFVHRHCGAAACCAALQHAHHTAVAHQQYAAPAGPSDWQEPVGNPLCAGVCEQDGRMKGPC